MAKFSLGTKPENCCDTEPVEWFPGTSLEGEQMALVDNMKIGDERDMTVRVRMVGMHDHQNREKSIEIDLLSMESPNTQSDVASKLFPNQGKEDK